MSKKEKQAEKAIHRVERWMDAAKPKMLKTDLAKTLGETDQVIQNWFKRDIPRDITVRRSVAAVFGRTIDELDGIVQERPMTEIAQNDLNAEYSLRRIPVKGFSQVSQEGVWKEIQQHPVGTGDGYINMPSSDQGAYALRIVGDSAQSRVRSGEYVVIEPGHPLVVGEEVLIQTKSGLRMIRDFLYQREGLLVVQNIRGERTTFAETDIEKLEYVAGIVKKSLHTEK